jgi:hypothetical protein
MSAPRGVGLERVHKEWMNLDILTWPCWLQRDNLSGSMNLYCLITKIPRFMRDLNR